MTDVFLPEALQEILVSFLKESDLSLTHLRHYVQHLNILYHERNFREALRPLTPQEKVAYALVRAPITYYVTRWVLKHLQHHIEAHAIKTGLDLGAGLGTGLWAMKASFPQMKTIKAIERDPGFLAWGQRVSAPLRQEIFWECQSMTSLGEKNQRDVVLMSYSLNELQEREKEHLWRQLWDKKLFRLLILIEPGTPASYQSLMKIRQDALDRGGAIIAPCPHGLVCPLLKEPGQWCHFSVRVPHASWRPQITVKGANFEDEPVSYLVILRESTDPLWKAQERASRLIGSTRKGKGHVHLDLCTLQGNHQRLTLTKRKNKDYVHARHLEWGDVWPFPPLG